MSCISTLSETKFDPRKMVDGSSAMTFGVIMAIAPITGRTLISMSVVTCRISCSIRNGAVNDPFSWIRWPRVGGSQAPDDYPNDRKMVSRGKIKSS
jgi:hypothetical protein